ncbi:MAG: hypothetical protein ACYDCG_01290 [Candidatus Acidiferrales bacterium]
MAAGQAAEYRRKSYLGRILVVLGLAALLADLAFLAAPLERLVEKMRDGLFGVVPTLGLSFLNAARAIALHQIDYFSMVSRILILFSAIVAVVIGGMLWSARPAAHAAPDLPSARDSLNGDR